MSLLLLFNQAAGGPAPPAAAPSPVRLRFGVADSGAANINPPVGPNG